MLDLPPGVVADAVHDGDRLELRVAGADAPILAGAAPRNVRALSVGPGVATLILVPGATLRRMRIGDRMVFDVLDAARAGAATPPPKMPPRNAAALAVGSTGPAAEPATPRPALAPAVVAPSVSRLEHEATDAASTPGRTGLPPARTAGIAVVARIDTAPVASPEPHVPPGQPDFTEPVAIAAAGTSDGGGGELTLPFGPQAAIAAFRRGREAIVVVDERRPIDLSQLREMPLFAGAAVQLAAAATILHLPLADGAALLLRRVPLGWRIAILAADRVPEPSGAAAIRADVEAVGVLRFRAAEPGRVITLTDPDTGGTLLVGTQRAQGQGVPVGRSAPGVIMLPTWQGVALEPITDALVLRAVADGFVARAESGGGLLALAPGDSDPAAAATGARFSRRFAFDALGLEGQGRKLQSAILAASAAPPQSRGPRRVAVAQAMVAEGRGAEAQAVLAVAAADDPRLADDPDATGLAAIAAVLAGRPEEAGGLDDPRLNGADDIALWRAVRLSMLGVHTSEAAAAFAATVPLLLSFPGSLRERLLPVAAEAMLRGGARQQAAALLAAESPAPSLGFARALALEFSPSGRADIAAAISAYDRLTRDGDRRARAQAGMRAIELRLAGGLIGAAQAAPDMERLIFAWRGDRGEFATRLRAAALRQQAEQWREALALLRETETLWPDDREAVRGRLRAVFVAALQADETHALPPLELVALTDENADLIAGGAEGDALAARIADRLSALDLPSRAAGVLQKLMVATGPGASRAAIGASLAGIRMQSNDPAGALAALAESQASSLPDAVEASRALVGARALAAQGQVDAALDRLGSLPSADADELRASLAERRRDWPSAEASLRDYLSKTLPAAGPLDAAQVRIVLRLASAAAQAGDEAGLAELRRAQSGRLPAGDAARMFALLTQSPVSGIGDLARVARETEAAGELAGAGRDPGRRPLASR